MTGFFYELGKIVWGLVVPETLLVLIVFMGLLAMIKGYSRTALALMATAAGLLAAIGIFPLGNFLLVPLESRYPADPPLRNVTAIVILGGGSSPEISERWKQPALNASADRFIAGADLARRFPSARVYFTGGNGRLVGSGMSEAVIARQILTNAGIDTRRIVTESRSRSTAENAQFLHKFVPNRLAGQWVLVTSAFHMPRAMATFCASGWWKLTPYPTDYRTASFADGIGWNLADHLSDINVGAKEWVGLVAYKLTGRASGSC